LLDLGCGAGPIAITLARRAPGARVWAVDVNERARALCAANAERNGLTNVTVAAPGDVPVDVRLATIWSNPPIRIGKAALHELLAQWLRRLAPDGRAVLVVHKHLGSDSLQRWLVAQRWPTRRLTSAKGYRLLEVSA
jgi:16S rRNA G1207 methylase RsmC